MARKSHQGKSDGGSKARATVTKEVAELGRQVAATIRAVAESEELRGVGKEVANSLGRVTDKVADAVKTAAKSEKPRAVAEQLGKVVDTGRKRGMEAGERMRVNLANGLREIGQELTRLAQKLDE